MWAFPPLYVVFRTHRPMWANSEVTISIPSLSGKQSNISKHGGVSQNLKSGRWFLCSPINCGWPVLSDFVSFSYLLPLWFSLFLLNRAWAGDRQHHPALYLKLIEPCAGHHLIFTVLNLDNWLFWQHFPPALPTWGGDWSHTSILWF